MSKDIKLDKDLKKRLEVSDLTYTSKSEACVRMALLQDFNANAAAQAENVLMKVFPHKVCSIAVNIV